MARARRRFNRGFMKGHAIAAALLHSQEILMLGEAFCVRASLHS
jgi:hypothetical protein